jgi:hypothetical protein
MRKPTFAERCLLAEQCLPDAPYRAMLKKLHTEMMEALAEQPAQSTPFAYVWTNSKGQAAYGPIPHDIYSSEPLYKAPQPAQQQSCYCPNCEALSKELAGLKAQPAQRKPMTDEQFLELLLRTGSIELVTWATFVGESIQMRGRIGLLRGAKLIKEFVEAAHNIKENT